MNQINKLSRVQKGIDTIDKVVPIALQWMENDRSVTCSVFHKVFCSLGEQLVNHYIGKWEEYNDFARFYLDMDMNMVQLFFAYYDIPLEPDPYNADDGARASAQLLEGKDGFDFYPFEAEITRQFYLTGYINPLDILIDIAPRTLRMVKSKKIDLYGSGTSWSKAWKLAEIEDKMSLILFLIQNHEPNHDTKKKTSKLLVVNESANETFSPRTLFLAVLEKYGAFKSNGSLSQKRQLP